MRNSGGGTLTHGRGSALVAWSTKILHILPGDVGPSPPPRLPRLEGVISARDRATAPVHCSLRRGADDAIREFHRAPSRVQEFPLQQ